MTTIVRHPELNGNRWTKVIEGQGGALIKPSTYEVIEGILCGDCEIVAPHLKVNGGEWLMSATGVLCRSAGLHIESNGASVCLLLVEVGTGARRRLAGAAIRHVTVVSDRDARDEIGQSSELFNQNLQDRARNAVTQMERAETSVALYRALSEVQQSRTLVAATSQTAVPVPAPTQEQSLTVDIEASGLDAFEQAITEWEETPQPVSAAPATSSPIEQPVSLGTLLRSDGVGSVPAFRGTVRHRRW